MDKKPRVFRPNTLFDANTFERIQSDVRKRKSKAVEIYQGDDDDDDDDNDTSDEADTILSVDLHDQSFVNDLREKQLEHLTQTIRNNRPVDDEMADIIIKHLDDFLVTTTLADHFILSTTTATDNKTNDNDDDSNLDNQEPNRVEVSSILSSIEKHPYPPVNQTGVVKDHDRPYVDYGHLDRETIAGECQFNLQLLLSSPAVLSASTVSETVSSLSSSKSNRFQAKSFAITAWTHVSKEIIMNEIKREFGIENIQYICIGEEISEMNHRRHLHIQIIFKRKIHRRKPFLDKITQTHCNYQVTDNDCAWNEYIKKGGDYIEFNEFKSTRTRGSKQWPTSSVSSSSVHTSLRVLPSAHLTTPTSTSAMIATTVRAKAEEKRKHKEMIAEQANVNAALNHIKNDFPWDFLHHFQWFVFTYDNLICLFLSHILP